MKLLIRHTVLLGLVIVSLASCVKKAEDDPLISLRSRKARLTGTWEVQQILVGDHDLLSYQATGVAEYCGDFAFVNEYVQTGFEMSFDKDGDHRSTVNFQNTIYDEGRCQYDTESGTTDLSGSWEFQDSKTVIGLDYNTPQGTIRQEAEIVRLSQKELVFKLQLILPLEVGTSIQTSGPSLFQAQFTLRKVD